MKECFVEAKIALAERNRFPAWGTRGCAKKIGTEVLPRLGRVGVKPRKLELKRRIEEDTAIVRAVSPPSMFLLKVHPRHLLRDIGGGVFSFLRFFRCLEKKEVRCIFKRRMQSRKGKARRRTTHE